jgi:hypothetical protein
VTIGAFLLSRLRISGPHTRKEEQKLTEETMTTESTFWKSIYHQERFLEVVPRLKKTWPEADGKFDPEYAAALYILTADSGTWSQAQEYIDRDGIDFEEMLEKEDFSGGYTRLMKLAGNLFNDRQNINPVELLHLDHQNFLLALDAIKIRRYGFRPN